MGGMISETASCLSMSIQLPRTNTTASGPLHFLFFLPGGIEFVPKHHLLKEIILDSPVTQLFSFSLYTVLFVFCYHGNQRSQMSSFLDNFVYLFFSVCQSPLKHKPHEIRVFSSLVASMSPRPCKVFRVSARQITNDWNG